MKVNNINNFNKRRLQKSFVESFRETANAKQKEFEGTIGKWRAKNTADISDEESYLKLNKTIYTIYNCTF